MRTQLAVGDLVFDVQVEGPEDAPAVLLLHGFPQSAHCWRKVLPYLEGFRVIVPDQRGYSPGARTDSYVVTECALDALGILDALGVAQAHVVGHDWGAAVAWQLGARHAERVRTLTAVCVPHPLAFIEALRTNDEQRQASQYMREFAKPGYDAQLLADDGAGFRLLFGDAPVDVDHMLAMAQQPGALAAWLAWYRDQRLEVMASTPDVTAPTLHVWPDGDVALRRTATELTRQHVTGPYRLEVLEGVSHWVPEEAPHLLGPLLQEHLR